ncbi:MAG: Gfo/Idh/MocA family oxidoreductase [Actinobacteria bacterium]|nr:Gfo/Idh/MocA family oxidoreductase [Actinomycetota bacterium]
MPTRVGIMGLGFMGKTHFDVYSRMKNVRVVAIFDTDIRKLRGNWSSITGNIGEGGVKHDLSAIRTCSRLGQIFDDPDIDVVDITLPTHLHAKIAIRALKAGKHVICEKPMARTSSECQKMIEAARKAKGKLFVAHCIRFWPEYAKAKAIVRSGKYGKVFSAVFTRLSSVPIWSHQNWMQDPKKSGTCALDLHIHDVDFILHLFGKPKSVTSRASGFRKGRLDHIVTTYDYGDNLLVTAEAGWEYPDTFPFSMAFRIAMEKATLAFQPDGLMLYPARGKARKIRVKSGDGYEHELRHFVGCIAKNLLSELITPEDAARSVKTVEAEIESVKSRSAVKLDF